MRTTIHFTLTLALIAAAGALQAAEKFDPAARAKTIAPFIDEETIAVLHVDLSRIKVGPLVDKIVELVPEAAEEQQKVRLAVSAVLGTFAAAGGKDAYVIVSLADVGPHMSWLPVIVPLYGESDGKNMAALLGESFPEIETARMGNVLVACEQETLDRLNALKPVERPELVTAFQAAGDTAAQALLLPPAYSRRVIEEMMPQLPEELGGGPSTAITRGLLWGAVGVDPPPNMALRAVVQSQDRQAALVLRDQWKAICQFVGRQEGVRELFPNFDQIVELLRPNVQDDRLTLTLDEQNQGIATLLSVVKPPLIEARTAAMRTQSMHNLQQIGLAMHNYHDVSKHFPAAASYDAQGKPLLSWRVHILPYLNQKQLYDQFHRDEPWDSEHNRELIDRMPPVYRSSGSSLKQQGRASYLVPVGKDTVFPDGQGLAIKVIKDGNSRTIMVVEVNDEHAVVWTKPEDLPFDPEQPAQGLGGPFEGGFLALFCDGHVQALQLPQDPAKLRALFTRAGGEPAESR